MPLMLLATVVAASSQKASKMSMFDGLTPEQQQAVMRNVAQRVGGARDLSNVATKLRGNDQATAQAMQYVGMDVPANLREGEGDPSFDVFQILDGLADDTATSGATGGQVDPRGQGSDGTGRGAGANQANAQTPQAKPSSIDAIDGQAEASADGSDMDKLTTYLGAGAGTAAGIYALRWAYNRVKSGEAGPDEQMIVDLAIKNGIDVDNLPAVRTQGTEPMVIDGDYEVVDDGQKALPPQPQQQLTDQRPASPMQDQTSGSPFPMPDETGSNMNLEQALRSYVGNDFQIPNMDIGMQGVDPMEGGGELLKMMKTQAKPRVRIKP